MISARGNGAKQCGIALSLLGCFFYLWPGEVRADWIKAGPATVWDGVGVLFKYRLVRVRDDKSNEHTYVIDCNDGRFRVLASDEGGSEGATRGPWSDTRSNSLGSHVQDFACERHFARNGKFVVCVHDNRIECGQIWSQVGRHLDFRLSQVSLRPYDEEGSNQIWVVHCPSKSVLQVAAVRRNGFMNVNRQWENATGQYRTIVDFVCGQ